MKGEILPAVVLDRLPGMLKDALRERPRPPLALHFREDEVLDQIGVCLLEVVKGADVAIRNAPFERLDLLEAHPTNGIA